MRNDIKKTADTLDELRAAYRQHVKEHKNMYWQRFITLTALARVTMQEAGIDPDHANGFKAVSKDFARQIRLDKEKKTANAA